MSGGISCYTSGFHFFWLPLLVTLLEATFTGFFRFFSSQYKACQKVNFTLKKTCWYFLYVSMQDKFPVSAQDTLAREDVSKQSTFAGEHVSMQGTLAYEHVSTQGRLARKHARHFSTWARKHARHVSTFLALGARNLADSYIK